MSPSPPSPTRQPTSRRTSSDIDTQQSGRSPTVLHAQASSASLSQGSFQSADPQAQRPKHLRPASTSSRISSQEDVVPPLISMSPVESRSEIPALHKTSSSGSSGSGSSKSRASREHTRTAAGAASSTSLAAALAEAIDLPPPPRIPAARRSDLSSRGSSDSLTRTGTPRSVRELGSDYTRYYNPFSSNNNSVTDLRSPPSGYPASSSQVNLPLLGAEDRRHSNPFVDNKRSSASPIINQDEHEEDDGEKHNEKIGAAPVAGAVTGAYALDQAMSFFPYLDDRLGAPNAEKAGYTFPMMWDEKEDDDDMHMPMVDDDVRFRPKLKERFSRENITTSLGMIFMLLGVLTLFIILPVFSSTGVFNFDYSYDTPISEFPSSAGEPWAHVNDRNYALMQNIRAGLVDPDTPKSAMTKVSEVDGKTLNLVFSDEFNDDNRTFYPGDDPYFFGFDGWYGATQDLEYYDPDAVSTYDGVLELRLDSFINHGLNYRSGMLNSWNQLCFKGGIWEVSVSLPGPAGVHGLWPGVWSMGNLGRPGYLSTTDGLWPYTYNSCDAGITPNQSMSDGTSKLPGQRLTSCGCAGSDHPTPGTGRGAPEIDILEGAADYGGMGWGTATQSFQVAPFDIWYYPNYEFFWIPDYNISWPNGYTGGPYQQAVSVVTVLNNDWYDGKAYQTYSYDYKPGKDKNAFLSWQVGGDLVAGFDARSIGPNGNIGQRMVSEEPMSMIINLGISNSWTTINWTALNFPAVMRIDYIRLYQRDDDEVTCDPKGYETTKYIADHPEAYQNPNYTHWTDVPDYTWPKNTLMGC